MEAKEPEKAMGGFGGAQAAIRDVEEHAIISRSLGSDFFFFLVFILRTIGNLFDFMGEFL